MLHSLINFILNIDSIGFIKIIFFVFLKNLIF